MPTSGGGSLMKMLEIGCGIADFFWDDMSGNLYTNSEAYKGKYDLVKQGLDLEKLKKCITRYVALDRYLNPKKRLSKACSEKNMHAEESGFSDIQFVPCQADGAHLPFAGEMFDFIVLVDVFSMPEVDQCDCYGIQECSLTEEGKCENDRCPCSLLYRGLDWKTKKAMIQECLRVLKTEGHLFAAVHQTSGFARKSYAFFEMLRRKRKFAYKFSGLEHFIGLQKIVAGCTAVETETENAIPVLPAVFYNESDRY